MSVLKGLELKAESRRQTTSSVSWRKLGETRWKGRMSVCGQWLWVAPKQTKCKPDHLRGKEWHQILEFLSQRVGCSWPWVATWAVRTMRIPDSVTLRWMCTGWILWKHWGGKPRLEPWRTDRIWISSNGYITNTIECFIQQSTQMCGILNTASCSSWTSSTQVEWQILST